MTYRELLTETYQEMGMTPEEIKARMQQACLMLPGVADLQMQWREGIDPEQGKAQFKAIMRLMAQSMQIPGVREEMLRIGRAMAAKTYDKN